MTEIEQRVINIIQQELNLKTAPALTDELSKFNTDSLDRAEIIFGLEDEFGVELTVPDKATAVKIFTTVESIARWVADETARLKA
jgi:acyl carrier protein